MSNRITFALNGTSLAAALALTAACTQPAPVEAPPPPPMAEASQIELYGGPETGPHARAMDCPANPYPVPPPPHCFNAMPEAYAQGPAVEAPPQPAVEDQRRPGWGTMDPIPNPGERGYAQAEPPHGPVMDPADGGMITVQRLPSAEEAASAEGVPASANPSVVVTMEPIPNPEGQVRQRSNRREAEAALAGGPARSDRVVRRVERRESVQRRETRVAPAAPARVAAAPAAPARAKPARTEARDARRPAATTPALRAAALDQMRDSLANLVRRDASFTAPRSIVPGQTETITLTLPAGLAQTLGDEAQRAGLRNIASDARIRATLTGDGWRIVPADPQTETVRAGQPTTFDWQATAEQGARPLRVDIAAELAGGPGAVETLALGQREQAIERAATVGGGVSPRAIAAGVLLLLALLAVLYFIRRSSDDGVVGGGRRRRRHREPVNLTPYAPGADPAGPRDTTPPATA